MGARGSEVREVIWYKLETWRGGEEGLVREIRRTVPPYMYDDVFVIQGERDVRRQGRVLIERRPLLGGCAFLTCGEAGPLMGRLDMVPAIHGLISAGHLSMFPLMERDAAFLRAISGEGHLVRASYVLRESEGSARYRVYGPLEHFADGIESIRFSSRYAKAHRELWGEDTVMPLGILLDVDVGAETYYEGVRTVTAPPAASRCTVIEAIRGHAGEKTRYRAVGTEGGAWGAMPGMPGPIPEVAAANVAG